MQHKKTLPKSSCDRYQIFQDAADDNSFIQANGRLVCSAQFESTAYNNLQDYISGTSHETMSSWELGYEGPQVEIGVEKGPLSLTITPPPNSASVGSSSSDKNSDFSKFFSQEQGSISRSRAKCSVYGVNIDIDNPSLTLHSSFEAAILKIDKAADENEKHKAVLDFIEKFGTHYAKHSIMGIGSVFETRYTQKETLDNNEKTRNDCSSNSGGFQLFGFGAKTSKEECSGSLSNTVDGQDTSIKRFTATSFGTLPNGAHSLNDWTDMVKSMMDDGSLDPLPIEQTLAPIVDILLTDVVANLAHDDGTKINHKNVIKAVVDGYMHYRHGMVMEIINLPVLAQFLWQAVCIWSSPLVRMEGRSTRKSLATTIFSITKTNGWCRLNLQVMRL